MNILFKSCIRFVLSGRNVNRRELKQRTGFAKLSSGTPLLENSSDYHIQNKESSLTGLSVKRNGRNGEREGPLILKGR